MGCRRVGIQDAPLGCGAEHAQHSAFHQGTILGFALAQGLLRASGAHEGHAQHAGRQRQKDDDVQGRQIGEHDAGQRAIGQGAARPKAATEHA